MKLWKSREFFGGNIGTLGGVIFEAGGVGDCGFRSIVVALAVDSKKKTMTFSMT